MIYVKQRHIFAMNLTMNDNSYLNWRCKVCIARDWLEYVKNKQYVWLAACFYPVVWSHACTRADTQRNICSGISQDAPTKISTGTWNRNQTTHEHLTPRSLVVKINSGMYDRDKVSVEKWINTNDKWRASFCLDMTDDLTTRDLPDSFSQTYQRWKTTWE